MGQELHQRVDLTFTPAHDCNVVEHIDRTGISAAREAANRPRVVTVAMLFGRRVRVSTNVVSS